tara:strand:- start:573 stop:1841 length:1269 start_codon:yes stop_codon:yes gene_type:complete
MACKGSGVQIPSAPLLIMKTFFIETKELFFSQGIIAFLSIIQVAYTAKLLGPSNYGKIALYIAITGTVFRILSSRNADVVLLFLGEKNEIKILHFLILDFLLGAVSFLITNLIFFSADDILNLNFRMNSLFIIFYLFSRIFLNFNETFKGLVTYQGKLKIYSYFESGTIILRFILVILFLTLDPSVNNYFLALGIYSVTSGVISFIYVLRNKLKINDYSISFIKFVGNIKNSFLKIRIDQAIGVIPTHLDIIIIGFFTDSYEVGIYQFAKKLIEPINYLVVALNPWILNKLKLSNSFSFKILFIKILSPIAIILVSAYYFYGKTAIIFLSSNDYLNSFTPLMILLVGFIFYFLTFWTRQYLLINNSILSHTRARIINTIVFIISSSIFIDMYSYNGIALSISLGIISHKLYELKEYFKVKKL